jgi:hypothetical protein
MLGKLAVRKPLTFPVNETFTRQWRNVPALSPNMGWGACAVELMRTVGWACSLLVVLALALFAYSSRTVKHHAGVAVLFIQAMGRRPNSLLPRRLNRAPSGRTCSISDDSTSGSGTISLAARRVRFKT